MVSRESEAPVVYVLPMPGDLVRAYSRVEVLLMRYSPMMRLMW